MEPLGASCACDSIDRGTLNILTDLLLDDDDDDDDDEALKKH